MISWLKWNVVPDTNNILYKLCKTTYAKKTFNSAFIIILAFIFRTLLYGLLSLIFIFNNVYVDFIVQCILSIYLCTQNGKIQLAVEYFEPQLYAITKYTINNYSNDNYNKWKNVAIFSGLMLSYIYFMFVEINSALIRLYLLEYLVCYVYLDIYENPGSAIKKSIVNYIEKHEKENTWIINIIKRSIKYEKDDEYTIIDKSIYNQEIKGFVNVDKIEKPRIKPLKCSSLNDFVLIEERSIKSKTLTKQMNDFDFID